MIAKKKKNKSRNVTFWIPGCLRFKTTICHKLHWFYYKKISYITENRMA